MGVVKFLHSWYTPGMQKIGILWSKVHQSWCVVGFSVGVILGVILGLILRINYFASGWFLVLAGFLLVFSYVRPLFAMMILAVLAGFLVSFFRVSAELFSQDYVAQMYEKTVMVVGKVAGDPEIDEGSMKVKVAELTFGENCEMEECVNVRGSIYVSVSQNVEIVRGDIVSLYGKMSEGFGTYVGYMYRPKVVAVKRPEPGDLILAMRIFFAERVRGLLPETEAKLGLSYLLGMKSGLPDELSEQLRVVGLTHIVVASGTHLAILVEVAKKIFGKASRFAGLLFSVLFILFFMSMVGWTPSILRAGVMSILTLVSWYVGRKIAPWRIILMVAAGTLILNPMFVIDLGWLLSFSSFIGIMMLSPRLKKFFYGTGKPGFIAELVITTIAATVMTLPVVLFYYGQVSLISVVANLLILPTLSIAMGLTFFTGVLAGVPLLETAVAFLATKLLDYHIAVVGWFGGMTQFLVKIEPYQAWVFLIYGAVAIGLLVGKVVKLREVKNKLE